MAKLKPDTKERVNQAWDFYDGLGNTKEKTMEPIQDLYEEPDYEDEAPVFGDPSEADRALWHVRKIRIQDAEDEQRALENIAAINRWLEERKEKAAKKLEWWLTSLESYHTARLSTDPKAKTLNFPNGQLKARVGTKQTVSIEDKDAALAWAQEHRPLEFEKVTVSLDTAALKQKLELEELVLIPGVVIVEPKTTFSVDTNLETEG